MKTRILIAILLELFIFIAGNTRTADSSRNIQKDDIIYTQDIKPQNSRRKVVLKPVEPGYTPKAVYTDRYYIEWADKYITLDEFKLICVTTACEGGCLPKYKDRLRWIAKTIVNRYCSTGFQDTVTDVIYAPEQYDVTDWAGFPEAYMDRVTDAVEEACFLAVATDWEPHDLYYFNSVGYFSWADNYDDDGVMYFSCERKD